MTENHPLARLLTPEGAAKTVLFLTRASPQMNSIDIILNADLNIK